MAGVSPAFAQESEATPAPAQTASAAPAGGGDIIVTGSRIARAGFNAPTPVTVVGAARFEELAATNVGEALAQLPAFSSFEGPTNSNLTVIGNIGARTINLRQLGAARTLVLVDGRRFVPSSPQGTVDVNLLPTIMVDRVELVTGGASAAYGSDAVAGVVNIILNKQMTGLRGQVQYGLSEEGDDREYQAALAGGTSLFGGAGHLVVGGEYSNNKGVGNCYTRAWCSVERSNLNNPGFRTNGLPAGIPITHNHASTLSPGGLINASKVAAGQPDPLKGIQFAPDGSPIPFHYGYLPGTFFMEGGDGHGTNPYISAPLLKAPVERYSLYSHLEMDLGSSIQGSVDLSYGYVDGHSQNAPLRETALTIKADNPFLPDSIRQTMAANNIPSLTLGRQGDQDIGYAENRGVNRTFRVAAALNGDISGSWKWDAYYQYGNNDYRQTITTNKINANFALALDAVRAPNGVIVCRSTLTDPTNGCQPLNLIGIGNYSQAAIDYAFGTSVQQTRTRQHVAAANIRGDLFSTWAGPVSIATGVEARRDSVNSVADPISQTNGFLIGNGQTLSGHVNVKEAYLEALVPLGLDTPFFRVFDLNGALRVTDYSTSGTVVTWKAGAVYEPIEQLRFRVTRSRDIRAPNILELNGGTTTSFPRVIDPATARNYLPLMYTGSNPDLKPEVADTWTAGVVIKPEWSFLSPLRLSIDYFDIKVKDAITSPGAQTILDRCAIGVQEFCNLVTFGPAPEHAVLEVRNPLLNLNSIRTRGVDFELDYAMPVEGLGRFNLRLLATYVADLTTTDAAGGVDRAGQTGYQTNALPGIPKWTVNGLVTFDTGPLSLTTEARYIPTGIYDVTRIGPQDEGYATTLPASIGDNRVTGRLYLNVAARYKLIDTPTNSLELYGAINNLFDKDPPVSVGNGVGTNAQLFDTIGRRFRAGVRFRY
jgi:outer membrane receptor protein involved in Fe transport